MGQKQCDLRYGIPGHTAYALQDFPPFTYPSSLHPAGSRYRVYTPHP